MVPPCTVFIDCSRPPGRNTYASEHTRMNTARARASPASHQANMANMSFYAFSARLVHRTCHLVLRPVMCTSADPALTVGGHRGFKPASKYTILSRTPCILEECTAIANFILRDLRIYSSNLPYAIDIQQLSIESTVVAFKRLRKMQRCCNTVFDIASAPTSGSSVEACSRQWPSIARSWHHSLACKIFPS